MATQRNALKAGLFIVVSLALVLAVVFAIKGFSLLVEPSRQRTVAFSVQDDLGGLRTGDDVRIGGFKVGTVDRIVIEAPSGEGAEPRLVVAFSLPTRFAVREGYLIRIQTSVTGQSVLNFEKLGTGPAVPEDVVLAGAPSAFSETVADLRGTVVELKARSIPAVTETALKFGRTADAAASFLTDVRGQIKPVVEKYNAVADAAKSAADRTAEMMVQMRDMFGEGKGDFKGTLANLNSATGALKEKLPPALDRFSEVLAKLNSSLASADAALKDIRDAARDIKDASASASSILVANRGKIESMVASLKAAGDNLKNATAEIRRSPWRLLYKPDESQAANMNLFDAARHFADGAGRLADAAQALRDAAQDRQADPAKVKALMEKLEESFKAFSEVERKLWTSVRD